MILLKHPDSKKIQVFLDSQKQSPFSYEGLGMTRNLSSPEGYSILHSRNYLGHGLSTFEKAKSYLNEWKMFDIGWVELFSEEQAPHSGQCVAIVVKVLGLYTLNAAQVVYTFEDESNLEKSYGFAYGTLSDHAESGEERFSLDILKDESVWYEIFSFSNPNWKLAKLANPYVRILQKRFINHSSKKLKMLM